MGNVANRGEFRVGDEYYTHAVGDEWWAGWDWPHADHFLSAALPDHTFSMTGLVALVLTGCLAALVPADDPAAAVVVDNLSSPLAINRMLGRPMRSCKVPLAC